jgi:hypothetical protein
MNKEDIIIEILWEIIERKYESYQLLKKEFFGKEYEFEEYLKLQFDEFIKIIGSDELIGYVHGWIDQAVPEFVVEDFLFSIFNNFIKYQPDQNGDSGILVFYEGSFYTFELSRENNSVTMNKYKMNNELSKIAEKLLR